MIPRELLKKVRRIQIQSRHQVNDVFAGQYHSAFKGQGIEFEEVREYVPGDDIRSIDWNVTARSNTAFVKKFREERELTLMLMVDLSASTLFGSGSQLKKDLAAEVSAVLAFSAIRNNDRVGLILFSNEVEKYIPPEKGVGHVLRVIREILYAQPKQTGTRIIPALDFLNHVCRRKAVCFLLSDFITDEELKRSLSVSARRHDLTAICVSDRRERAWPDVGLVSIQDAETGKRSLIDTGSKTFRQRYLAMHNRRDQERRSLFRQCGVDSISLETGMVWDRELAAFFKRRKKRLRGS